MLVPLTRKTFETLVPTVATGAQYAYCSGKIPDFLRRLLISVVGIVALLLLGTILRLEDVGPVRLLLGIASGLYWLWGPILWASIKNFKYRRFAYAGLWRGEVLDVYITNELIGQEETVNNRGELVITDNRERCLNIEVGDESGFVSQLQVPLRKDQQAIARGDRAEMVVLSSRPDLSRITATTDIYIPDCNVWVSDYPYLQREAFIEVSQRLEDQDREARDDDRPRRNPRQPRAGASRRSTGRVRDQGFDAAAPDYDDRDQATSDRYGTDTRDRPRVDDYFPPRSKRTPRTPGSSQGRSSNSGTSKRKPRDRR
jgi:hypothetical protein